MLRTNISPKFVEFKQTLDDIHATFNNEVHRDSILALVNKVHTKEDDAKDFRMRASEKSQARHNTIIDAFEGSGYSNPIEEEEDNSEQGGNLSSHHQRSIDSQNDFVTSTPCAKIDFSCVHKYLRVCLAQTIEIPLEVTNL